MVVETGEDERAPIILGQPFLSTTKAIIYTNNAKICFTIKGKKEKFIFKNHVLQSPAHPQTSYIYKDTTVSKKKKSIRNRKSRTNQPFQDVKMVNAIRAEYDHHLTSPFLDKEDLGIPSIDCSINERTF